MSNTKSGESTLPNLILHPQPQFLQQKMQYHLHVKNEAKNKKIALIKVTRWGLADGDGNWKEWINFVFNVSSEKEILISGVTAVHWISRIHIYNKTKPVLIKNV